MANPITPHKDPADRAHFWERPMMDHELAPTSGEPAPTYPKHVNGPNGTFEVVTTKQEEAAARARLEGAKERT